MSARFGGFAVISLSCVWLWVGPAHASEPIGCADGSREGFTDLGTYPVIASCGGAWDVPGAFHDAPSCGREAGNDGGHTAQRRRFRRCGKAAEQASDAIEH